MAFHTHIAKQVAGNIEYQGRRLYYRNAVKILAGDEADVQAQVKDGALHTVDLYRNQNTVTAKCTCNAFARNSEPCKHIWATILVVDAKGFLQGKDNSDPRHLVGIKDEELEAGLTASGASTPVAQEYTRLIRERIVQLQRIAEPSREQAVK